MYDIIVIHCIQHMVKRKKKEFKDTPIADRPRELMKRKGAVNLSDEALMQILLGSGIKGKDVISLSKEIWSLIRKKHYKVKREDLEAIKGLGVAKISKILACIELSARLNGGKERVDNIESVQVWEKLSDVRENKKEHFIILFLDSRHREIRREVVSIGTINASIVHPREVFQKAIEVNAVSILGVHNHPSDDVDPSDADLAVTGRLVEAGRILGIEFVDHIIISKNHHYSIRDHHDDLFD